MGIRYDEEFKKQLVDEYIDGKSYPQLAKKYGIAKSTIVGWVRKHSSEERKYNSESQVYVAINLWQHLTKGLHLILGVINVAD